MASEGKGVVVVVDVDDDDDVRKVCNFDIGHGSQSQMGRERGIKEDRDQCDQKKITKCL